MSGKPIRVGLVGAGYIARWHGDAIKASTNARVATVCDVSAGAAGELAAVYGAAVYTSLDEMIAAGICDAVHILTPPHLHKDLAIQCLQGGLHCFVEKPFALSLEETKAITAAAQESGKHVGVGHNFLGLPAYDRLKSTFDAGGLGKVASADFNWNFPLAPLRSGPFGLWMLQEPKNLLLELSPHLFAFAIDLFGPVEILHLDMGKPVELSGGGTRHQSFRILARAGDTDLNFNLTLAETMDDRSITLRGSSGIAQLNYAADTLVIARENAADIVLNPLVYQLSQAWAHLREGSVNFARHVASLNRNSAYGVSFARTVENFYHALANGLDIDPKYSAAAAENVMQAIERSIQMMPDQGRDTTPAKPARRTPEPSVLVIGGTGFIGRHLTRALVKSGRDVRVLSRGKFGPFADISDHVELFSTSLKDPEGLRAAMQGIDAVYDLAKSVDTTWEACLQNDVGVRETIAQAALDSGVKRLIYTGTIASFDMSDPNGEITDATEFDADMSDRNLYARSKAECEKRLMDMHRKDGLPLVIARPGIVVGAGGPLQHWGIGRWQGAGTVRIWGKGNNILPFTLIEDVCDGLIKMLDVDTAVGQSFNLVGEPMMTARDYFDAIHETLGAKIQIRSGNLHAMYLADGVKSVLKKHALRRQGVIRPSLRDWKSRAHYTPFKIDHTKQVLNWHPTNDRHYFIEQAITKAGLFGF